MSNQSKELTGAQKLGGLGIILILIGLAGALFFFCAFSPAIDSTVNFDLEFTRLLGFIGFCTLFLAGLLISLGMAILARIEK
jgi:hypothetical protein